MKERQIVAIDVGSSNVVIAVGAVEDDGRVNIQGIVSEPIEGIDAGRVENIALAGSAVKAAKQRIEQELNIKITEAYAGLSGDFVRCVQVTDYVYVQDDSSNQITERDLEDLDRRMRSVKLPDDREEILSMEAVRYTIDDKVVDVPVGAYGHKLNATYNFILSDRSMRDRLNQCLMNQGIKVKEFAPNALISHLAVATDEDIEELARDIERNGLLHNIVVSDQVRNTGKYMILSGERRYRAVKWLYEQRKENKYAVILCKVLSGLDPLDEMLVLDAANLQTRGGMQDERRFRKATMRFIENLQKN